MIYLNPANGVTMMATRRERLTGVDSDNLYPLVEQQDLAAALPRAELKVIRSLHGHDGFLIEMSQVGRYIEEFLEKVGRSLSSFPLSLRPLTIHTWYPNLLPLRSQNSVHSNPHSRRSRFRPSRNAPDPGDPRGSEHAMYIGRTQ